MSYNRTDVLRSADARRTAAERATMSDSVMGVPSGGGGGGGPAGMDDFGQIEALRAQLQVAAGQLDAAQDRYLESKSDAAKAVVVRQSQEVTRLARRATEAIDACDRRTEQGLIDRRYSETQGRMRLTRSGHLRQDIIDLGRNVYDSQKMHRAELTKEVEQQVALRLQESGRGGHTTQAQAHDIAQALVRTGRERQIFQMALQELRDAVDERQRVDELEQSCEELFLLLKDFQRMVVSQADLIEAVHRNVQKGLEDARRGEADLRIAKKESKTCCTIM